MGATETSVLEFHIVRRPVCVTFWCVLRVEWELLVLLGSGISEGTCTTGGVSGMPRGPQALTSRIFPSPQTARLLGPPGAGRCPALGTDGRPPAEAAPPLGSGLEGHRLRPAASRALRGLGDGLALGEAFGRRLPSPQTDTWPLRHGQNLLFQVRTFFGFFPSISKLCQDRLGITVALIL